MSNIPADLRYVDTDEWIRIEGEEAVIGITDFAQEQLGDIVYLELPDVGSSFQYNETFGVIESVKAASDLYAPLAGEVVAVNSALVDDQAPINSDPYGEGWMIRLKVTGSLDHLLDAEAYRKSTEERAH